MQFLVDDTPEECLSKAQGFFSTNWPYGGTFQPYSDHLHLEGPNPIADTWQHNLRKLFLALITFSVIILYWYMRLWPTRGRADVAVAWKDMDPYAFIYDPADETFVRIRK